MQSDLEYYRPHEDLDEATVNVVYHGKNLQLTLPNGQILLEKPRPANHAGVPKLVAFFGDHVPQKTKEYWWDLLKNGRELAGRQTFQVKIIE
jgi:hypothetical protein